MKARGSVVGSGKLDTPCERMQSANLTASSCACCIWASVGGPVEPDELDELDEFEPHAAIALAAVIAATAIRRFEVVLDMMQVISGGRSHGCNTPALDPVARRYGAVMCGGSRCPGARAGGRGPR